jgi:hypothetical protein
VFVSCEADRGSISKSGMFVAYPQGNQDQTSHDVKRVLLLAKAAHVNVSNPTRQCME